MIRHVVGKDYFDTTGIPLPTGRAFRQEDETGVKRMPRIEPPEIAGIVRDHHKVSVDGMTRDAPVCPSSFADAGDMLSFITSMADTQALINQKFHLFPIVASFRRVLIAGGRSCQGCVRGRPRSGYATVYIGAK